MHSSHHSGNRRTRRWFSLTFWILLGTVFASLFVTSEVNSQAQIHPRIFFSTADIPGMVNEAGTTHQEIWAPIEAFVNSLVGTLPPTSAPVNGSQDFYRDSGLTLPPIALACVIGQNPAHCDTGREYLLTYAGWSQWSNQNIRGLALAHMVMGNALAYDWLYDYLSVTERQTIATNLAARTQELYEASVSPTYVSPWANWWSLSYMQNHYGVTHGALGLAALVLLGEDGRAQQWLDHAIERLQRLQYLLDGIGDGTWHESAAYQSYMMATTLPFMVNLRRLQGVDIIPHNYYQAYPYWRLYNYIPNSTRHLMTLGDFEWAWGNSRQPQHLLRFSAAEYGDPYAEWIAEAITDADGRTANLDSVAWYVFEYFYYNPAISPLAPDGNLPPARDFSDMGGVIWRTGWSPNDIVFGLQSGQFGGDFAASTFIAGWYPWQQPCTLTRCSLNIEHAHNDAGSFYIYAGGSVLAQETIGVGNINTSYHNTLLIDGQGQYRPPADNFGELPQDFIGRDGFIERSYSTANFMFAAADATNRYAVPDLNDFTRNVLFVSPNYFVMVDNVQSSSPHTYDWTMHYDQDMILDGNWLGGGRPGTALALQVVQPQQYLLNLGNDGTPYVRIRPAAPASNALFVHLLDPVTSLADATGSDATIVEQNSSGLALRVAHADSPGVVDDMVLAFNTPGTAQTIGNYTFDGKIAFVSAPSPGSPSRLFVAGGTSLTHTDGGTVLSLVQNLNPANPFEVVFSGDQAAISGTITTPVRLFAPSAQTVTVNDLPAQFARDGDYIILGAADPPVDPNAPTVPGSPGRESTQNNAQDGGLGLSIAMLASPGFAALGGTVTWTITVENTTNMPITDVVIKDLIPIPLAARSMTASRGTLSRSDGLVTLTLDRIEPGDNVTLTIETLMPMNVVGSSTITNIASAEKQGSADIALAEATISIVTRLPNTGEVPPAVIERGQKGLMAVLGLALGGLLTKMLLLRNRRAKKKQADTRLYKLA